MKVIDSLLKLLYRHSHPSRWRHNERLWPYVRIARDEAGAIRHFQYRGRNVPLASRVELQRSRTLPCHIIASGPSIAEIDYRALPMQHVMGVNGSYCPGRPGPDLFRLLLHF